MKLALEMHLPKRRASRGKASGSWEPLGWGPGEGEKIGGAGSGEGERIACQKAREGAV